VVVVWPLRLLPVWLSHPQRGRMELCRSLHHVSPCNAMIAPAVTLRNFPNAELCQAGLVVQLLD
jgi:hypothetical protein